MSINSISNPYPITGTVVPLEHGYSSQLGGESAWLTDHGSEDLLKAAADRIREEHGNHEAVLVTWYEDGTFELQGPTGEDSD